MSRAHVLFSDRTDAGRRLGAVLRAHHLPDPVVLGLPRGGVPVAWEVAQALNAPLGVVLVRKLGAPYSSEFAIGAVAQVHHGVQDETGKQVRVLDPQWLGRQSADSGWLESETSRLFDEIGRRRARYAGPDGRLAPPLAGRAVIVVDDGIATGYTMRAALMAVAAEQPARLLFAAPVGSADMVRTLQALAEGVCLHTSEQFGAVSLYYSDFTQTSDEEVVALLTRARRRFANPQQENSMQTISEVMTQDVAVARPDDNLQQAAQLMNERDVGSLPVCDGRRLIGMITDRDITVRATAEGRAPEEVRVAEIMSEGVSYCYEDQTVDEVLRQMGEEQIRRLPVVDREMQLCGVVAIGDIARNVDASIDDAMEGISSPPEGGRPSANDTRMTDL